MREPLPPVAAVVQALVNSTEVSAHLHQGVWHLEFTEDTLVALVTEQRRLAWAAAQAEAEMSLEGEVDEFPEQRSREAELEVVDQKQEHANEASGCEWCGSPLQVNPLGRHRRYCSPAHRQRAYEVRTALVRRERDRQAGKVPPMATTGEETSATTH
ncbi:hypothetical protein ABZ635_22555 [Nocardiopsis sp. NPDC007018]|uniref:hypothetical protein n=1 Tax=Nocardiopsis sp. NPDC007018 TaxID=3155721 RepID=UPI0033C60477